MFIIHYDIDRHHEAVISKARRSANNQLLLHTSRKICRRRIFQSWIQHCSCQLHFTCTTHKLIGLSLNHTVIFQQHWEQGKRINSCLGCQWQILFFFFLLLYSLYPHVNESHPEHFTQPFWQNSQFDWSHLKRLKFFFFFFFLSVFFDSGEEVNMNFI